ncbi:MAG: tryptophan-rich sensory protein [Firmicutes bacterium]|nr:tryptophan-rich sensory protein [Bacillota bacterium]
MEKNRENFFIKGMVAISFAIMVLVNGIANILPINGINTGQVSDLYFNLFAPAGITFSIWGVIYLLLLIYTLYQFGLFQNRSSEVKVKLLEQVGILFTISSIANTIWIFAWHYQVILLSLILMLIILVCLIMINRLIMAEKLSMIEKFLIAIPFSIYFGWITIATIANVITYLVSIGWTGFGLSAVGWMVIILLVGLLIGGFTMVKNKDVAYGLVLIWAYIGIFIKHTSIYGFSSIYPAVIVTVIICIVVFVLAELYLIFGQNISRKK